MPVQVGVAEQRPVLVVRHPEHRLFVADLQVHHLVAAEHALRRRVQHRPAAQREHRVRPGQQLRGHRVLQLAERGLAVGGEDVPHAAPGALLDDQVGVHERQAEPLGEQVPDGGLARAHEPDQHDHGQLPVRDRVLAGRCWTAASSAMACSASW